MKVVGSSQDHVSNEAQDQDVSDECTSQRVLVVVGALGQVNRRDAVVSVQRK
jgi:hypothetical protein